MSNTVVVKVISASVRKVFAAQKFESIIAGLVKHEDQTQVTPSMVSMTKAAANAAMGGKATPQSFVNGLLFNISAHAYGQKPSEGLPAHAMHAIEHAQSMIKKGAGIDARTLKLCAMSCMEKVLSMPTKAEQSAIEEGLKPAIDVEFKVIPEVFDHYGVFIRSSFDHAESMDNQASENYFNRMTHIEAAEKRDRDYEEAKAKVVAEMLAEESKNQGPDFIALFDKLAADHADQAEEMLRTMAAHLGYRLTKIPAKKAA